MICPKGVPPTPRCSRRAVGQTGDDSMTWTRTGSQETGIAIDRKLAGTKSSI